MTFLPVLMHVPYYVPKKTKRSLNFFCQSVSLAVEFLFAFHAETGGPNSMKLCRKLNDIGLPRINMPK